MGFYDVNGRPMHQSRSLSPTCNTEERGREILLVSSSHGVAQHHPSSSAEVFKTSSIQLIKERTGPAPLAIAIRSRH